MSHTIQSNTDDSKVSDSGSDDDLEDENDVSKNGSFLDDNEKTVEDQEILTPSESCIENGDQVKKRKRKSLQNDTEDSHNEPPNLVSIVTLDSGHPSTEIITNSEIIKKKKRVYVVEETDDSMNVTSESLLTPNAKRKKNKRRSKHEDGVSSGVMETVDSSIASEVHDMNVTSDSLFNNTPNSKQIKAKRRTIPDAVPKSKKRKERKM